MPLACRIGLKGGLPRRQVVVAERSPRSEEKVLVNLPAACLWTGGLDGGLLLQSGLSYRGTNYG
jgi:hypothetical protein